MIGNFVLVLGATTASTWPVNYSDYLDNDALEKSMHSLTTQFDKIEDDGVLVIKFYDNCRLVSLLSFQKYSGQKLYELCYAKEDKYENFFNWFKGFMPSELRIINSLNLK